MAEVNARLGTRYRWQRRLAGGEQDGAHLLVGDAGPVVLKAQPAGWRSEQLLHAFPAVVSATSQGWPAARWLAVGPLAGGGAYLLQEHVDGTPLTHLDVPAVRAVLAANARQHGIGSAGAPDDAAALEAVLSGDCPWKAAVAAHTAAGAALVQHGDEVAARAWPAPIPTTDVVHGDCSSTNVLLDLSGRSATFVDCQTIGRGSRVRDLADLYRQGFVHPDPANTGLGLLRRTAVALEGPRVFARCAVAVSYNNLAWWVEHRSRTEFDQACLRLHRLFDGLSRRA